VHSRVFAGVCRDIARIGCATDDAQWGRIVIGG
jgi:hypothetical protein